MVYSKNCHTPDENFGGSGFKLNVIHETLTIDNNNNSEPAVSLLGREQKFQTDEKDRPGHYLLYSLLEIISV